jgi:L-arabinose isomerase
MASDRTTPGSLDASPPLRPRVGILFVTSGWFREVGLQDPSGDTTARVEELARRTVDRLSELMDPVYPGVLFSVEEARRAGRHLRSEGVEGLLLAPLMWCEDQIVRAALGELPPLPLLLWTYSPESELPEFIPFQRMIQGSGAVCTLQLSGMLRREGYAYRSVVGPGDDEEVYREIAAHFRAVGLAAELRSLRVGVLPFPCDQMSTTYVDEFALRRLYGVQLRYLELERVRRCAAAVSDQQIAAFREGIEAAGQRVRVEEGELAEAIRYALALETVMTEEGLTVLAMNDVIEEMHSCFGLRPCLTNPRLSNAGAVISMEADVAAGICMHLLRRAFGQSPMYTETFSADYRENALLLGHAGYHDTANADPEHGVEIVPDVEYENSDRFRGAVSFFKHRPGPVTVVNSVWDGEALKWVAFEGTSLAGPPKMDGNTHLYCRLDIPVRQFYRRSVESGVSQHWIVVSGSHLEALGGFCEALGIRFLALSTSGIVAGRGSSDGRSSRQDAHGAR